MGKSRCGRRLRRRPGPGTHMNRDDLFDLAALFGCAMFIGAVAILLVGVARGFLLP